MEPDDQPAAELPAWDELELSWEELKSLPENWRDALSQWRGVYYIFDASDGTGHVGCAYGSDSLLGRWLDYATSDHGGSAALRDRDPAHFRFTILQLVAPDMEADEVIGLESNWKELFHIRMHGPNAT
jgi:hypothetical protein